MFQHDQAVYLVCQFMSHGSIGTLNLQRLRDLKVLEREGEPPKDFDPARYEASAFGIHPSDRETTYVLRFRKEVAPYIRERVWHPSQRLRDVRGGGVELTFTCGESHEVTSWVASWREWVEVLQPPSLASELGELGRWLVEEYETRARRKRGSSRR
jgi:proteasome accessory factor B